MYRLLAANGGSRERRDLRRHLVYSKPELLAVAPNQIWSGDITKLKGPGKWAAFHLYVTLDIFSRLIACPERSRRVGWKRAGKSGRYFRVLN